MNEDQIKQFLERYGQALSTGDLAGISNCWAVPALVLSDLGAISVTDSAQIESFFAQAVESYHAQGIMVTRPELERTESLTEQLTAIDVRWHSFDEAGAERSSERSHYVLWLGENGQPRIRVALTRVG